MPDHTRNLPLDDGAVGEIVQMALSDHVGFDHIQAVHGLSPDAVKALMRSTLAPGSYRAWRKRVRQFGERRAHYK
ncbi:DUF2805 domain-containing protein [Acidovorax temperans]|uniref:DUF2805 domain-containing protein n=1 Tax=Acidovorax temperans TaxID=80878 RepID=UPI0030CFBCC3